MTREEYENTSTDKKIEISIFSLINTLDQCLLLYGKVRSSDENINKIIYNKILDCASHIKSLKDILIKELQNNAR